MQWTHSVLFPAHLHLAQIVSVNSQKLLTLEVCADSNKPWLAP